MLDRDGQQITEDNDSVWTSVNIRPRYKMTEDKFPECDFATKNRETKKELYLEKSD